MALAPQKIVPCLWFDTQAEDAAKYYVSVFKNAKMGELMYYGTEGNEVHGKPAGQVLTAEFELEGQRFLALNGGPQFKFDEAVSFQIFCETQDEVDYFWDRLGAGGKYSQCGWLKDKFGLSWQIVPSMLPDLIRDQKSDKGKRVMRAMLGMSKLDIAALKKAAA